MVVRIEASGRLHARKVLGWPNICKLAHALLWEHSYKRLKLGQLLGQLCICLALRGRSCSEQAALLYMEKPFYEDKNGVQENEVSAHG